ncbi:Penicillin-binding protein 1A [Mycobacterium talmoniae]|uniref:Penicillin-binding protein 1A n=1 Tax=Mycobacterium talmoniae TaxID=1858794 RepID=A0A2S8BST1_9MYCO|nr:Penicillin-binding protein 1A [Mycobacterium talmoniae]
MAYFIVDIPKPGDIRTNQVSTILASDGSELAKIVPPEGNRVDVNIDQVPVHVRNAVIAAEDRDFYSNPGFSFSGFARAIKNNIFGGDLQGGSTITQQYVKNALVGAQRSGMGGLLRKSKELVIAAKMSSQWSKDDVLQAYLNIIYFGRGAYGIAAASEAYFGKPVEQLNVAEGALLAALIQRPSTLIPRSTRRRRRTLELGARRHGGDRRAVGQRPPRAGLSAHRAAGGRPRPEPDLRAQRADPAAGHQGAARPVRHRRADAEHPGAAGHHHHRPEGSEGRRGRGGQVPRRAGPRYAGRGGVHRSARRRGQGLLRRHRRARVRLRAGRAADRVVVQGVRVGGGAGAGHRAGVSGGQLPAHRRRHQDHQRGG